MHMVTWLIHWIYIYLLGGVKLTKNANPDKYSYSGYGIGFNLQLHFLVSNFGFGRNIIIFGVDNGSSTRVDNRKKDILVLGEAATQGLDDTAIISGSNILLTIPLPQKKNF